MMNRLHVLPASFVICLFLVIVLCDASTNTTARPTPTGPLPTRGPERCDSRILVGMPGAPGTAGPQGLSGVQGPAGYPGAPGNNGINGSPGKAGSRGAKGDAGEPGELGFEGLTGPPGLSGPAGPRGVPGVRGPIGPTGAPGEPGLMGLNGELGLSGDRGPLGRPGRQGERGFTGRKGACSCRTGPKGEPVKLHRAAKSAFSAARTSELQAFNTPPIVTYQKVFSNQGNHFNKDTGIFRCAVAGTYFFTMSVYKSSTGESMPLVQLLHNGDPTIAVIENGPSDTDDMATNSVVLELEAGDEVYLQLYDQELYSGHYRATTFTGFLLFEA